MSVNPQETYETERPSTPIDDIESTWYELARSHDYSALTADGEYLYSMERLEELGRAWMKEVENPIRSARSIAEAIKIVDLLIFEISYRQLEGQV